MKRRQRDERKEALARDRAALDAARAALRGAPSPTPSIIPSPAVAELGSHGVEARGAQLHRGDERVARIVRTITGDLRAIADPQPKPRHLRSPTYLDEVRKLPCSLCAASPPSQANHHPGKGPDGGGSDLATHPVCDRCHRDITEHRIKAADPRLKRAVADTLATIFWAVREGKVSYTTLTAVCVELAVN